MKKIILVLSLLLMLGVFVSGVNCPPSLPKTYIGNISVTGSALVGNFEIRAVMGEDTVGIGDVSAGNYNIDVSPCSGTTGQVIFYINGIQTNEKGDYAGISDWGKEITLDLTLNAIPSTSETCGNGAIELGEECDGINLAGRNVNACGEGFTGTISCSDSCLIDYSNCDSIILFCGDAVCNNGETCSTCAVDCGVCAASSGGGGGGGGGGSSTPTTAGIIYAVSETQVGDGISKEINAGDKIKFSIAGGEHSLNLEAINGNYARITVQSNPITFVLELGNTKKIDFETDGFYDLYVELESITNGKAKIKIQAIHEEAPAPEPTNQTAENNETNGGAPITGGIIGFAKSGRGIGLVIGLAIIVVGLGIIIYRKKR